MKTFIYKPQIEGVSGEIELQVPTFDDKLDFAERFASDEEAEEKLGKVQKTIADIQKTRRLVDWSKRMYKRVDVKVGEEQCSSFDELSQVAPGDLMVMIVNAVTERIGVSKKNAN